MSERAIPTHEEIARLIAKGSAERSRVIGGMIDAGATKIGALARAVVGAAVRRAEAVRAERELRLMDPRMLADIGLTPGEIPLVARGELARRRPPVLRAANESVAQAERASSQAA